MFHKCNIKQILWKKTKLNEEIHVHVKKYPTHVKVDGDVYSLPEILLGAKIVGTTLKYFPGVSDFQCSMKKTVIIIILIIGITISLLSFVFGFVSFLFSFTSFLIWVGLNSFCKVQ